MFFCVKQKTAYEMRMSDWSSDVCSSDLARHGSQARQLCPERVLHEPGKLHPDFVGRKVGKAGQGGLSIDPAVAINMGKCPQSIGDQRLGLQAHLRNIVVGPQVRGWYPARSGLGTHTAVSVALRKDPAADPLARLDNHDIMSRRSEGRRVGKEVVRTCRSR